MPGGDDREVIEAGRRRKGRVADRRDGRMRPSAGNRDLAREADSSARLVTASACLRGARQAVAARLLLSPL